MGYNIRGTEFAAGNRAAVDGEHWVVETDLIEREEALGQVLVVFHSVNAVG